MLLSLLPPWAWTGLLILAHVVFVVCAVVVFAGLLWETEHDWRD